MLATLLPTLHFMSLFYSGFCFAVNMFLITRNHKKRHRQKSHKKQKQLDSNIESTFQLPKKTASEQPEEYSEIKNCKSENGVKNCPKTAK